MTGKVWLSSCFCVVGGGTVAKASALGHRCLMPNIHDDPAALKALQDDIYRERILRARSMTEEQRLADVFELSNFQFGMLLGGAMNRIGTTDEVEGWG